MYIPKKNSKSISFYSTPSLKNTNLKDYLVLIPIIVLLAFLPFIVRYHEYNTSLSKFNWFSSSDQHYDFFLYYKQFYFVLITSLMLLTVIVKFYISKAHLKHPILIPLVIYEIMAIISTITSKYSSFGITGIFEQFESLFVLLGYSYIVCYIILFIDNELQVKKIIKTFIVSTFIMTFLGVLQTFGFDFFNTIIGKQLILPSEFHNNLNDFIISQKAIYLTMYNPNYVGVYVSLITPVIISLLLLSRKLHQNMIYLVLLIGLIICLYGSKSEAGILGLFVSLLFVVLLLRRCIIKKVWLFVPLIIGLFILSQIKHINYSETLGTNFNNLIRFNKIEKNLKDIRTEDDLYITYKQDTLRIGYIIESNNIVSFYFADSENQEVSNVLNNEKGYYEIIDDRFSGFTITPIIENDLLLIKVLIENKEWVFTNQLGDNTYYYINQFNRPDKINTAKSAIFTGYESFASGRGYLWSRSIPLLKDHILLGSGADTFSIVFPQQDYVNLYNYGFVGSIVTKPHSMYLQIGVQTGLISLLAILVFYGIYFFCSIRLYINNSFENYYSQIGVSILFGTIGYMITGISNDSSITVSPIFWCLIGLGIVCNSKVNNK